MMNLKKWILEKNKHNEEYTASEYRKSLDADAWREVVEKCKEVKEEE